MLEWFNPKCPYVIKHYADQNQQTMNRLAKDFKDKDVVWLAINSGNVDHDTADKALNIETHSSWGMKHPILMDASGDVGRMYNAKRTPEMYIINAEGILVYHGAIDNDSSRKIGTVNYVEQALNQVLAGETVTQAETKAYGCSVKY